MKGEWNNKSRTLSDQPTTCPLCGAVIRQSRNLRRHLELLHFGAGSGSKTARVKKDQFERNFSKTPLSLLDNQKSDNSSYSTTMPSLNLSLSVNSGSSSIGVPGSLMISGTSALNSSDPGHHDHNLSLGNNSTHNNPVHSISYPPSSISAPSNANGLYSTESASMLSSLFPPIPTLTTLSSPHDMFRHSEFFRANMAYSQDPTRQQHFSNRQLQRMDAT